MQPNRAGPDRPEVTYEVLPHVGIGPVRLGISREESRSVMGEEPETFKKLVDDDTDTDAYHNSSFQVFFDRNNTVEYIEVSRGEPLDVTYKGTNVFETKANDLVQMISSDAAFDPDDPELGYSYRFPQLELALWRPIVPEDDDQDSQHHYFSTIGVGRPGYFSQSE